MQNIPLAWALMETAPIDQFIPGELIEPVAQVLRDAATRRHVFFLQGNRDFLRQHDLVQVQRVLLSPRDSRTPLSRGFSRPTVSPKGSPRDIWPPRRPPFRAGGPPPKRAAAAQGPAQLRRCIEMLVARGGLEPPTPSLRMTCSTS